MVDQAFTTNRLSRLAGGFALSVVLVANVPPFLCMGLDCDTIAFDLYLRGMQEGKILYRDMTENNLPGVMWVHGIIRELAIFDGLFVSHYLVETFIWRFSDPYYRSSLAGLYFAPKPVVKPA